jgi:hypothetical protein
VTAPSQAKALLEQLRRVPNPTPAKLLAGISAPAGEGRQAMSVRGAPQTVLEVKEEEECVPVIAKMLRGQRIIRVDGHSGMGKSRIAKCYAKKLAGPTLRVTSSSSTRALAAHTINRSIKTRSLRPPDKGWIEHPASSSMPFAWTTSFRH